MKVKIFSYNIHGLPFISESWTEPLYEWFNGCDYDIVCIQEAFTPGRIEGITKSLTAEGYTVLKPNDFAERQNLLGSGLITAVRSDRWRVADSGFIGYKQCIGAENLANKGFHWLRLEGRSGNSSSEDLMIVNTHMQADHPFNYFVGCMDTRPVRRNQMEQIIAHLGSSRHPCRSLIIGDLNSEEESHDDLVYLTGERRGIRKHTFEPTGEDLDHVAFLPRLWINYVLPIVSEVAVLTRLWWSDHWPIHVVLELVV
jgi:exonuclease III